MRRPRVLALRAGFYVAVALSGFAAAYVLKEWLPYLRDAQHPARVLPASDSPDDDDKTSPRSNPQQDRSPKTDLSAPVLETDEVPAPITDPDRTLPLDTHAPTPSTSQTKTLPPLITHSLPPPLPSGHALLSSSSIATTADTISSPTFAGSFHMSIGDGAEDDIASHTNTSDTLADSCLDVMSPSTHVISRRRSMRAHDLFAASHISFTELGSMVAPQDDA